MSRHRIRKCGLSSAALLATTVTIIASAAWGDDQKIETVVVTGTMLQRPQSESPVTVLTSDQIQASGLTSTADVLRSLSADNSGTIPTAFGNGFAAGSSGVALRGLTVNSTLVPSTAGAPPTIRSPMTASAVSSTSIRSHLMLSTALKS